ncbi:DUF2866 domain-containing protein [Paraburkholderia sp. BL10I2N1]|uniref:DUF2866 domain-containing protein n=1 Tax=Paraburkholderia sp. BL10I2N1 TaxID=1938796 RepID=UPI00105D3C26|nr:DUF2866 domain-containing protein [Paraburkholderia sp. BL10I2N1]TDN62843.1 uncharacterized protein DUF2866 [Paraburkholderia sp. BL10I2N1]
MVQDDVRKQLRAMSSAQRGFATQTCTISEAFEPPWGRPYRVVEWSLPTEPDACRRVVPAESTAAEIIATLLSHVPGRRIRQLGEEI